MHARGKGIYLWKCRSSAAWKTSVCGLKEHSRTVSKPNALFWVVCRAWEDWAWLEGRDEQDIPVLGYEPDDGF